MSVVDSQRPGAHIVSGSIVSSAMMNPMSATTMDPQGRVSIKNEQNL